MRMWEGAVLIRGLHLRPCSYYRKYNIHFQVFDLRVNSCWIVCLFVSLCICACDCVCICDALGESGGALHNIWTGRVLNSVCFSLGE